MSRIIFFAGFAILGAIAFGANASSPFDIEFPIAELGGCGGKTECKAYCDDPAHHDACKAFAEKHGLGGQDADEIRGKFQKLEEDGGPGDCAVGQENPMKVCREFCNKKDNIRECVLYAKEHSIMSGRELAEAEKVLRALEAGATLPPQCDDAESCKETCEHPKDLATARACFEFAEKAGLLPEGLDREKAERVFTAISEGNTPFRDFRELSQCEDPQSDEMLQKCIAFGTEHGLIPEKEAELLRKTGGTGPGGCRGKSQCELYCEAHQDECMAFAEEHDLFSDEDRARMEEGMNTFREGLEQAPPEVKECLQNTVGTEVLDQIAAGTKMPSRELGEKMHMCFENFFRNEGFGADMGGFGPPRGDTEHSGEGFVPSGERFMPRVSSRFPPEVMECVKTRYGDETVREIDTLRSMPSAELESKLRVCFEAMGGGTGGDHAGQGGCRTQAECDAYCSDDSHREECEAMKSGGAQSGDVGHPPFQGTDPSQFGSRSGEADRVRAEMEQREYERIRAETEARYRTEADAQSGGTVPSPTGGTYPAHPPEGTIPTGSSEYQAEYQRQYEEQYRQQYQEQLQSQMGQEGGSVPPAGYVPPGGTYEPPSGEYHPPGGSGSAPQQPGGSPPTTGSFSPPDGGTTPPQNLEPAPPPPPPPTSILERSSILASLLQAILGLLGIQTR